MKRILVALDASPRATLVLDAAVDLARRTGAKVTLYRSVGLPPEIPTQLYMSSDGDLKQLLTDTARKELEVMAHKVPAELLDGVTVEVASPWDGICRAGQTIDADLIMVGSHGYHGLDRILGTTAAKVVNHADRSVLVVRNPLP
jgi:nucleotide-binding universal stress UspA family protein